MASNLTKAQFVNWLKQSEGKQYDFDGWYGFQCYDYANAGWNKLYPGTQLTGISAKNIHTDNAALLRGRATVHHNTASFLRSEEHTSELQSRFDLVCRLLLEKEN